MHNKIALHTYAKWRLRQSDEYVLYYSLQNIIKILMGQNTILLLIAI